MTFMSTQLRYHSIRGTAFDDVLLADFAAADALHYLETSIIYDDRQWVWDREVRGQNGDDYIIRDRPGDYKESWFYEGNGSYSSVRVDGAGQYYGHEGGQTDTISYQIYTGGISIDLDTGDGHGIAEAHGLSGQTIYGDDLLYNFTNAVGTNHNDIIRGSAAANDLKGLSGADKIYGENGHDTIDGGAGNDSVWGGNGNDSILGGDHNDMLNGGAGNDTIRGGSGSDKIYGLNQDDRLYGDGGNDSIWGGNGSDKLWGGSGVNHLHGGAGNDELRIEGSGGHGDGGSGDDEIIGGGGADVILGGTGDDTIWAGNGDDTIATHQGNDEVWGGGGSDWVQFFGAEDVTVTLDDGGNGQGTHYGETDTLYQVENIRTYGGDDTITTGSQANKIDAGGGDDVVAAGGGNDKVNGQGCHDDLSGGTGEDTLSGGSGNDTLRGGSHDDQLSGGSGNDVMFGGGGNDIMSGGSGTDGFVFEQAPGFDIITDFQVGTDWIGFTGFLADEPGPGGSWLGQVLAFGADNGMSTALVGVTHNGPQYFAKLLGVHVSAAQGAIADGSMFDAPDQFDTPGGLNLEMDFGMF
jgi:Ca2+-binding RTX toxin-like protein